jgi:mono/diheme cytochrome c family protein
MSLRPTAVLALTLAFAAVALAGCGGGGDEGGGTPEAPPETVVVTAETPVEPTGDAAAGKAVFGAAGCGNCHALADAGASGSAGPDLDALKPDFETVQVQVVEGGGGMPAFADSLSGQEIADVSAYVSSVAGP